MWKMLWIKNVHLWTSLIVSQIKSWSNIADFAYVTLAFYLAVWHCARLDWVSFSWKSMQSFILSSCFLGAGFDYVVCNQPLNWA